MMGSGPMPDKTIKTLYYAHAMCMYRRRAEKEQLLAIREQFPRTRVINPARYDGHPDKLMDTLGFCLRLITKCDAVVFSRILGKVTAGVGAEVNHALRLGLPVFEVVGNRCIRRRRAVRYVGRKATYRLYDKWRFHNLDWD